MRSLLLSVGPLFAYALGFSEGTPFRVNGQAWTEVGKIIQASDTLVDELAKANKQGLDLSGNGLQSLGAQFTVTAQLSEAWEAAFGFGAYRATHALGHGQSSLLAITLFQNFITQSRLTYTHRLSENHSYSATVGSFPYKYNPDVKNLGLYLLRGPVYPGILMGGFQDFHVDTSKSTMLGIRFHHALGGFSQDLILNNERELPPTFDWSLAYIAKYKAWQVLELGAGVNFYRLLPYRSALMEPGRMSEVAQNPDLQKKYIEIDSTGPTRDTVFFSHQGTKLMAMASMDFKPMFGLDNLGPEDLKLYGEAAVLGIKDYGKTYGDISRRIPFMVGFNLPTFRFLDLFSVEVEWYGARYRNDLALMGNNNVLADWTRQPRPIPSPKPVSYADFGIDGQGRWINSAGDTVNVRGTAMDKENLTADDWKWSVFVEKTFRQHIRLTAQIANDHYRPRPVATGLIFANGGTAEAFSSPKDWYLICRLGYFF